MSKKEKTLVLVLLLFFFLIPIVHSPKNIDNSWREKLGPRIKEKLQENQGKQKFTVQSNVIEKEEKVRVIVEGKNREDYKKYGEVIHDFWIIPATALKVPESNIESLAKNPNVKKINLDIKVQAFRSESVPMIKADFARENYSLNGSGVNISIVDTGVYNHSEFRGPNKIIDERCYCYSGGNGCCPNGKITDDNASDDEGHGTHCAGIAAGEGGNGHGYGVATDSNLLAVKSLNSDGGGNASDIIKGIEWAVENNAQIISLSLGANYTTFDSCYSYPLSLTVDNVVKNNTLVTVAAGNEGYNSDKTIAAPGCAKRALTVGSVDDTGLSNPDHISSFSSRGPTKDNRIKPDLMAPGNLITSTFIPDTDSYYDLGGTSMAAPHVAGTAALLYQKYNMVHEEFPDPDLAKTILMTAVNTTGMREDGFNSRNNYYGGGRIDAKKAINIFNYNEKSRIKDGINHKYVVRPNSKDLIVTLYWPEDENTTNNLNLKVGNSTHNYTEYSSKNDSVEQIFLYNKSENFWNIYVRGENVTGSQEYYLATDQGAIIDNITIKSPKNKTYPKNQLDFNVTANKPILAANFSVNNSENHTMNNDTSYHYYNISYPSLPDGSHNVSFYLNISNSIRKFSEYFTIDTSPPRIKDLYPQNNTNTTNSSIEFRFNATDNLLEEFNCSLLIGNKLNHSKKVQNASLNSLSMSFDPEGTYKWKINCSDNVNTNTTNSRYLNIDSYSPNILIKSPENKTYAQKNILINISVYDSSSGIDEIWLSNSTGNYSYSSPETATFSQGKHEIDVYANDSAGRLSHKEIVFTVDTIAPSLQIYSPVEKKEYNERELWFNISLNETGNTSLVSIDNQENITLKEKNSTYYYKKIILNENSSSTKHNVTFFANDSIGNMNSSLIKFNLSVPPKIEKANIDKPLIKPNETINITSKITEENFDIVKANITLPDTSQVLKNLSNATVNRYPNRTLWFYEFNDSDQVGKYEVEINVNDTLNNSNSQEVYFNVSSPVNLTINTDDGTGNSLSLSWSVLYDSTNKTRVEEKNSSVNFELPSGYWDLKISNNTNVSLKGVNITDNVSEQIYWRTNCSKDNVSSESFIPHEISAFKVNLNFSEALVSMPYNLSKIENQRNVFKCSNWSFSSNSCNSNWINYTINSSLFDDRAEVNTTSFSAFSLSETCKEDCWWADCTDGTHKKKCRRGNCEVETVKSEKCDDEDTSGGTLLGISPTEEIKEQKTWKNISGKSYKVMEVKKSEELGVEKINFSLKKKAENIGISIKKQEGKPNDIRKSPKERVYRYFEIETQNIEEKDIEKAIITFQVNKSWLKDNLVFLQRFSNDSWEIHKAEKISEGEKKILYRAEVSGFSYFAVTGSEERINCPYECCQEDYYKEESCNSTQKCENNKCISVEKQTCPYECCEKGVYYEKKCKEGFACSNNTCIKNASCPSCSEPSKWSECTNGTKRRTKYICSEKTGLKCENRTETKKCKELKVSYNYLMFFISVAFIFGIIIYAVMQEKEKESKRRKF